MNMRVPLANFVLALNAALFGVFMAQHDPVRATITGIITAALFISSIEVAVKREATLRLQHEFITAYIAARKAVIVENAEPLTIMEPLKGKTETFKGDG